MNALRRSLFAAFLVTLLSSSTARSGEAGDPIGRARRIFDHLKVRAAEGNRDSLLAEFEQAETELRDHLAAHPGKTADVLLLMDLYLARAGFDAFKLLWTGKPGLTFVSEPYGTIVDRALAADPRSGDLHYWRGYLYGVVEFSEETGNASPNLHTADAIRELREAVALKPEDERGRSSLAFQLLASGNRAEAIALYKGLAGGAHPMYLILHDWDRMPTIEGMLPAEESPARFSELLSTLLAFVSERKRTLAFRGTAADFERRCRKQWPAFRLVTSDTSNVRSGWPSKKGQRLEWEGDLLKPVPLGDRRPEMGDGGFLVEVTEWGSKAMHRPTQYPGIEPDVVFCEIEIQNLRPLSPTEETPPDDGSPESRK